MNMLSFVVSHIFTFRIVSYDTPIIAAGGACKKIISFSLPSNKAIEYTHEGIALIFFDMIGLCWNNHF
jgi:hypothetical protein